ncbi:MAG: hypothetical protein Q7I92_08090, partial [Humidesulfovibrio sp.]|nr:hypothetical protein [Humidesulfovibrio sp.]
VTANKGTLIYGLQMTGNLPNYGRWFLREKFQDQLVERLKKANINYLDVRNNPEVALVDHIHTKKESAAVIADAYAKRILGMAK